MRTWLILFLFACRKDPVEKDTGLPDVDGDGASAVDDCDDEDASIFPGAAEVCDGVDQDCDGAVDEGLAAPGLYADADGDGFGDGAVPAEACDAAEGWVTDATDCDDADASVHPGAAEWCNEGDDDCDGSIDEDVGRTWYADADADGWGDDATAVAACAGESGEVAVGGDCADDDPARHPGAAETDCTDPVDYNCDGTAGRTDADADGYAACEECDDADAAVRPDATELCNAIDDDCDAAVDEGATDAAAFYEDEDGDGFGDPADAVSACDAPSGYVADATDCDDRDGEVFPGAEEVCDGEDDDCDGTTDEDARDVATWYLDRDGDGWGDDTTAVVACDAPSRYVADPGDCDDDDDAVHPAAAEVCNDLDDDCDGDVDTTAVDQDTWYTDADDDGYGDPAAATLSCDAVAGAIRNARDCDDADAAVRPYAWEVVDDGIDNDCDGLADTLDTDVVNEVSLGDDAGTLVEPTAFRFPLCGNTYSNAYFQSNGRVTFGSSDTDYTETAAELAADAAVAALWDDLDPRYYGPTLAWVEHDDAVAFYWRDVTEYTVENASTGEVVIFDDGRILLGWGDVDATDGLAGFSCGTSGSSTESDLGAEMASRGAGRWGIGSGAEEMVYELFDGSTDLFDLANTTVRLCGNDGSGGDPCADE